MVSRVISRQDVVVQYLGESSTRTLCGLQGYGIADAGMHQRCCTYFTWRRPLDHPGKETRNLPLSNLKVAQQKKQEKLFDTGETKEKRIVAQGDRKCRKTVPCEQQEAAFVEEKAVHLCGG